MLFRFYEACWIRGTKAYVEDKNLLHRTIVRFESTSLELESKEAATRHNQLRDFLEGVPLKNLIDMCNVLSDAQQANWRESIPFDNQALKARRAEERSRRDAMQTDRQTD